MREAFTRWCLILALAITLPFGLSACGEEEQVAEAPAPVTPTRDAITYFGRMILVDHQGPKAQIHLKSQSEPLWFPAVRDARAFTLLPGEAKDITAIYVSDMAVARGWDNPTVWMPAQDAHFVLGSARMGGMGQPEAVPFSDPAAAEAFAQEFGGHVVAWTDIPEDYVIGETSPAAAPAPDHQMPHQMQHQMAPQMEPPMEHQMNQSAGPSGVSPVEFAPHDLCITPPSPREESL